MIYRRILLVSIILLFAGCGGAGEQAAVEGASEENSGATLAVASNYPMYFYASRIADGVVGAPIVVFPDIDGDPALWTPSAEQILLLQSADVVILNGAGAEPWLNLITLDPRRLVDTSANIADRLIQLEGSVVHQHGPEGEHSHEGTAFTTWLDPRLAIAQAEVVTSALIELVPRGEAQLRDNMATLEQELLALDTRLAEVFAKLNGRPVLFSHPVYQYLQRRYGINGESVHWEPGQEPTTSAWISMQQTLATHRAAIMIWEDEPLTSTAQRLSDTGIMSVPFQPVANRPDEGDYLSVMRENTERIESML